MAWELVRGDENPDIKNKPKNTEYDPYSKISAMRARFRLESMDQNDPLVRAYNNLTNSQLGALRLYTHNHYSKFNSYLRGREIEGLKDEGELEYIKRGVKDMEDALNSIPNSPDSVYYRGISNDPEVSNTIQSYLNLEPGDIISDKGFSSFTSNEEVAEDFLTRGGKNQNILLINKSSRLKSLEPITANPSESEHISMPRSEFKVEKSFTVGSRRFGEMKVITISDND